MACGQVLLIKLMKLQLDSSKPILSIFATFLIIIRKSVRYLSLLVAFRVYNYRDDKSVVLLILEQNVVGFMRAFILRLIMDVMNLWRVHKKVIGLVSVGFCIMLFLGTRSIICIMRNGRNSSGRLIT